MDEAQAIAQLKKRDINGLETLVRLHYVHAVRTAYLITRDHPLAELTEQVGKLQAHLRLVAGPIGFDQPGYYGYQDWTTIAAWNRWDSLAGKEFVSQYPALAELESQGESNLSDRFHQSYLISTA